VYSKLAVLQLVPTVARKITDRLSIGLAPTIVVADAALDPNAFAPPTAPFTYPSATHTRQNWGIGFQVGLYYEMESQWRFGASYKSPQWIEDFTFFTAPATEFGLGVDYPGIISLGAAYYGLPRTVWAIDFRYVDYDNTELFGHGTGYAPTGAFTGLGWRSVFSVSTGVQYQLNDRLSFRAGYLYTENPIRDEDTFFNLASPAIYEHIVAVGGTWQLTCRTSLSVAYLKAFENSIEGPWQIPVVGPVPGTSIRSRQWVDALVVGLQVKF
jgi:long-chain fatty acid transport protein